MLLRCYRTDQSHSSDILLRGLYYTRIAGCLLKKLGPSGEWAENFSHVCNAAQRQKCADHIENLLRLLLKYQLVQKTIQCIGSLGYRIA